MAAQSIVEVNGARASEGPTGYALAARLVRGLAWIELGAAGLLLGAATLVYGAEIVMRTFLNTSYPDYYEVVGFTFIYIFLFGAAALYALDEDIVIGMLHDLAPPRLRRWWVLAVYLLVACTMALVLVYTVQLIGLQRNTPTPLLRVPEAIKWYPLAIASVSIIASSLLEAWGCVLWIASGVRPKTWPEPLLAQQPVEEAII